MSTRKKKPTPKKSVRRTKVKETFRSPRVKILAEDANVILKHTELPPSGIWTSINRLDVIEKRPGSGAGYKFFGVELGERPETPPTAYWKVMV